MLKSEVKTISALAACVHLTCVVQNDAGLNISVALRSPDDCAPALCMSQLYSVGTSCQHMISGIQPKASLIRS